MDERADTALRTWTVLVVAAALLLGVPVHHTLGDAGLLVLLLATLGAVAGLAHAHATGRRLPSLALPRSRQAPPPVVVEEAWRSERWIAEAVTRGLRALEEWRLEQRAEHEGT